MTKTHRTAGAAALVGFVASAILVGLIFVAAATTA
jgi:hypothetical protein